VGLAHETVEPPGPHALGQGLNRALYRGFLFREEVHITC
jgi:hypothetical protein